MGLLDLGRIRRKLLAGTVLTVPATVVAAADDVGHVYGSYDELLAALYRSAETGRVVSLTT